MKKLRNNEKIALIKKYYKKQSEFLSLSLINYEKYNLYICINEIRKNECYRLSWFDLDSINDKDIDKHLSCEYIQIETINMIKNDFSKMSVDSQYHDEFLTEEDTVILNANIITEKSNSINVAFKKYLPKQLAHLANLIIFVFRNMPKKYEGFLFEILAKLTDTTEKYEYKREFDFDLFNDDIDRLFSFQICQRGKKYYDEGKIKFLEKIDDRYFSIVEGTEKYLTIIKYNEEKKKMQVYCSCPCEFYCKHMYSVILAIRNEKFNRFYKIMYKNPNKNLLERIMDFDYMLCLGVVEQNLEIINNYGEIELVPILDVNNKCNWEVLEDSEDEKLLKQIKDFLNNN
ncbi:MAG: SWIM zinc finger domain-containing protein [Bacilli bacterium]